MNLNLKTQPIIVETKYINDDVIDRIRSFNDSELLNSCLPEMSDLKTSSLLYWMFSDLFYRIGNNSYYIFNKDNALWEKVSKSILYKPIGLVFNKACEYAISLCEDQRNKLIPAYEKDTIVSLDMKAKNLKELNKLFSNIKSLPNIITMADNDFNKTDFVEKIDKWNNYIQIDNQTCINITTLEFRKRLSSDYISHFMKISLTHEEMFNPTPQLHTYIAKAEKFFTEFTSNAEGSNEAKNKFVKQLFGYFLTGETWIQKFFILYGNTASNGKSTFFEILESILGSNFCAQVSKETLLEGTKGGQQASPNIMKLKGKYLAVCRDFDSGAEKALDSSFIKKLNESTTARGLFEQEQDFRLICKLVIACNTLPDIKLDEGTRRRLCIINCEARFVENPDESKKNEFKADPNFKEELQNDEFRKAFFIIGLKALKELKENGYQEPEVIIKEIKNNLDDLDKFQQFVDDKLEKTENESDKISYTELFNSYKIYTQGRGEFKSATALFNEFKRRYAQYTNSTDRKYKITHHKFIPEKIID